MNLSIGGSYKLKSGITIILVGSGNIVNAYNEQMQVLIGQLPVPKYVGENTIAAHYILTPSEIEGFESELMAEIVKDDHIPEPVKEITNE